MIFEAFEDGFTSASQIWNADVPLALKEKEIQILFVAFTLQVDLLIHGFSIFKISAIHSPPDISFSILKLSASTFSLPYSELHLFKTLL